MSWYRHSSQEMTLNMHSTVCKTVFNPYLFTCYLACRLTPERREAREAVSPSLGKGSQVVDKLATLALGGTVLEFVADRVPLLRRF